MMAVVGLLRGILDLKRAVEKKVTEQKESFKKVHVTVLPTPWHANIPKHTESCEGEAIHDALLGGMHAKRSCEEDCNDKPAGPSQGPKRCRHRSQPDEKYEAIFELLKKVEEQNKQMEQCAIENKREALWQAQKALDAYNRLSERVIHVIVNTGGGN